MYHFDLDDFIRTEITGRKKSLLSADLEANAGELTKEIRDRKVLVIGGAGTIGSSFIRAICSYRPARLVVIDINENGLTELVRDCRSRQDVQLPADFKTYPVNFSDKVFYKIFRKEGPFDIVANFAAHKHVRSEKDEFSIEAMIDNNVIKAKELLDFLVKNPPGHFFCVSTDKAANPVNVMGASKKLMEEVILAYSDELKITTARFANVAFSNGSLLAGFMERMLKRHPLSCPSDVKRFFVSPEEAGQICLCACILGKSGDIFFPRLSEEDLVSFASIVAPFVKQFGFESRTCKTESEAKEEARNIGTGKYPVYFFESNTSGEKLYEEFYTDEEELDTERFRELGVVKNGTRRSKEDLDAVIHGLKKLFDNEDVKKQEVVDLLNQMLPGFQHIETGMNLDQKM